MSEKLNPLALASFIIGLFSVIFLGLGFIPGIIALILGLITLRNKTNSKSDKIFSIIGITTGSIAIILPILFLLFFSALLEARNSDVFDVAPPTIELIEE